MGAEYVTGDVTDLGLLRRFCRGLDRVYHTAAIVKEGGEWSGFFRVNVLGADSVAMAARDAGVRDFVHFSSVMVHGFDFPDGVTEEGPLDPADNAYCTTKILSEEAVLRHHEPGRFEVYVIRPGDVYGPGSVPWTIRPVEMMRRRQWVYIDSRRSIFNHVYIDNLLDGLDLVVARRASWTPGGRPGGGYGALRGVAPGRRDGAVAQRCDPGPQHREARPEESSLLGTLPVHGL